MMPTFLAPVGHEVLALVLSIVMFSMLPTMALKAEWIPMAPSASQRISPRRSGHTAFTDGTSAFVFGGYIEKDPTKEGDPFFREVRNDLWRWNTDSFIREQGMKGTVPGPRLATATACVSDKAYLFGGWDPQVPGTGGIILDTVHCLDLKTMQWSMVCTLPDGPTSRHVAVAIGDGKILIHNFRCTDHVWIFDPTTREFTKQPTTGASPGSLGLHTATMLDEKTLLIWGGAAKDGNMSNRSYRLNLESWEWTLVKVENDCPSARAGACLGTYNSNCAILFGGAETTEKGLNPKGDVWALHLSSDNDNGRWEKLLEERTVEADDASKPGPRNAASLTPLFASNDETCKQFLMTGGWAPFRKTWDDVFMLRLSE
jgi:Galactose oxidase, central domain/Kelch motif